ncbi:MAG: GTPase HflX [Oscillospiraceae bacterium]
MEEKRERAVLAVVDTGDYDIEESLDELRSLCETAGAEVVGEIVQKREAPDSSGYLGTGKLLEAKELCEMLEADVLIADTELTGSKQRNMERVVGVDVIDRTTLILDIFALSAKTAEGKLQVELAQLNYRLPRLAGSSESLSRLGGGIGTRGPGESKLESDRRYVRERIKNLKERLLELEKRREVTRVQRGKSKIPVVALVGYTNVGKSSLLNALTGADILAEDKLFATLDPTVRKLDIPDFCTVLLVDTVGFVSRLPHTLVDAFKSTLEEVSRADLILKIVDASDKNWFSQLEITEKVIGELGAAATQSLVVFNKCDKIDTQKALCGICVSAKTGDGLCKLTEEVAKILSERIVRCSIMLPFDSLALGAYIREFGDVISESCEEDGMHMEVSIAKEYFAKIERFAKDKK